MVDQQQLRTLLAQIQSELARAESLDAHSRELLRSVKDDLQRAVDTAEVAPGGPATEHVPTPLPVEEQQNRQGRLQQAMVALEGSHPQLASALEQGMLALSNLGL